MTASAGRAWALYVSTDGGTTYIQVAGLRTRSFKIDGTLVDVTTADSSGRWRELLAGAGVQTLEITAAGVYQQDASVKMLEQAASVSSLLTCRLVTTGTRIDGLFQVSSYKSDGNYNTEATFDITLSSAGAMTITYS